MLSAVIVLGCDDDLVSNQESGVKTHAELSDQLRRGLALGLHLCHFVEELAGARLGDGAQVLYQLLFGHSNTSVSDVEHVLFLIRLCERKI